MVNISMLCRKNNEQRKIEEAKAQAEEKIKSEQRKKIYEEAQKREAERVNAIMQKQTTKEKVLADIYRAREHEADVKSLQNQLELENKRDKVNLKARYSSM